MGKDFPLKFINGIAPRLISCSGGIEDEDGGRSILLLGVQVASLIYMFAVGCLCAFVYDMVRAFQGSVNQPGAVAALQDLLYWAAVSLMLCIGLLLTAYGQPRAALMLAAVGGALLYFGLISPLILQPISRAVWAFCRALSEVFAAALHVVVAPVRGAKAVADGIGGRFRLPGWLSFLIGGEAAE